MPVRYGAVFLQLTESWAMAPKPGCMLCSGAHSAVMHTSAPGQLVVSNAKLIPH